MSFRRLLSLIAMAFLWTGSQIPVYIFGGIPPYIYRDIGGTDRWIWFVCSHQEIVSTVLNNFLGSCQPSGPRRRLSFRRISLRPDRATLRGPNRGLVLGAWHDCRLNRAHYEHLYLSASSLRTEGFPCR